MDTGFRDLAGWRVGLVTNPTARVDTADGGPAHLIDRLAEAPNVTLAALFGPEHGLRGTAEAGARVTSGRDAQTGAPVYSLYGATRKPTRAQLDGLDALVFDVQDVGARFYTYISTMGLAMQAAADAGIPFVVLDRPNPLGDRVEGWTMEPTHTSFVGMYPIPITHGMTVGELARMIRGEGWLDGLEALDLRVVAMEGYRRGMPWEDAALPWVPPSPNVPDVETARVYPGIALFEGTTASEGRGTETPFLVFGAPWLDADALLAQIEAEGVAAEPVAFTPRDLPGRATNPKHEGRTVHGLRLTVTDPSAFEPVRLGAALLREVYRLAPEAERRRFFDDAWLAKLAGTTRLARALRAGEPIPSWEADVEAFRRQRAPYLLYE